MELYSDKAIIEGLIKKDNNVLKYVYDKYLNVIRHYVIKTYGSEDDVKDIFQEGIKLLIENIGTDFELKSSFITYFYSVCKNIRKMQLEKIRLSEKYNPFTKDFEDDDFTEEYDADLRRDLFNKSLEKLDEKCRLILKLFFSELSHSKIAKKLDTSENFIKKKKCQCQQKLMDIIIQDPNYPKIKF